MAARALADNFRRFRFGLPPMMIMAFLFFDPAGRPRFRPVLTTLPTKEEMAARILASWPSTSFSAFRKLPVRWSNAMLASLIYGHSSSSSTPANPTHADAMLKYQITADISLRAVVHAWKALIISPKYAASAIDEMKSEVPYTTARADRSLSMRRQYSRPPTVA